MAKIIGAGIAALALALALGVALPMPGAAQTRAPGAREAPTPARAASCVRDYRRALLSQKAPALIADFAGMGYQARYQKLVLQFGLMPNEYRPAMAIFNYVTPEFEQALEATARGEGLLFFEYSMGMNALPVHTDLDSGDPQREAQAIGALAECDRQFGFPTVTRAAPPSDLECAVRYLVGAQLFPDDRAASTERANLSAALHQRANPSQTTAAITEQIMAQFSVRMKPYEALIAEGNALTEQWRDAANHLNVYQRRAAIDFKAQDVQVRQRAAGQEVSASIAACEAKYGRTPPPAPAQGQ